MDLRKAILLKKPLQDNSLNNSGLSVYESAAEDSDSSYNELFYSFSSNSLKSLDNTVNEDHEISLVSEADKENTVIMKDVDEQDKSLKIEPIKIDQEENMEVDEITNDVKNVQEESIKEQKQTSEESQEPEKVSNENQIPKALDIVEQGEKMVVPEIIVEDPNENLVNPFTLSAAENQNIFSTDDNQNAFSTAENRESIEVDRVTKRKIQEVNKKSASKIPTRTHLYSPVQTKRKSLDKKSKVISKPTQRRTIYETRSMTVKPKVPSIPPVQTKIAVPKPVMHKCTFTGCLREFRTTKLLQDHLKTHPSASASSGSSFKCKWCDKVFELNTALTTHMLEKCQKITFTEKRKLLAQKDKQAAEVTNKRKSVFVAPPPVQKKRSPRRQTLNKSGVMITPKKSLKCGNRGCFEVFSDVLSYANHLVSHKYENLNAQQQK